MKNLRQILQAVVVIAIALAFIMPAAAIGQTKTKGTNTILDTNTNKSFTTQKATLFEDDFESYPDFVLDFPPWTQYDGDGLQTWGFETYDFENEYYVGSYIIFVPGFTTPPLEDDFAHSGEKYAACFDNVELIECDDWLITPQLSTASHDFYVAIRCVNHDSFWLGIDDFAVSEEGEGINITFWAKTGSDQYEADRFQVAVSTTTNDPASFTIISEAPYVEPPTTWTQYTYYYDFQQPELELIVSGGIGLTATVNNIGNADATNCELNIAMEGGIILAPSGGIATHALGDIVAGGTASAKTNVFGIGKPVITLEVTSDEGATATATYEPFVLLFFLLG
jgi:hypothetical protein